jgi:hypothetical protein
MFSHVLASGVENPLGCGLCGLFRRECGSGAFTDKMSDDAKFILGFG